MGILNVTPDSFSDGGCWASPEDALARALEMVDCGADIIDVGGESTRPGALAVDMATELDRVVPIIGSIRSCSPVALSVDTGKPEVMRAAVAAGATMINDVYALRHPGALEAASELDVPVCLMHMQGQPRVMQAKPVYADVVAEVESFLLARVAACEAVGIARDRIILDPGFGFGKTLQHNIDLFRALPRLSKLGFPVLVGISRKSMLGQMTGRPVDQRVAASAVVSALAVRSGASIIRVHDVAETADALKLVKAIWPKGSGTE